MEKSYISRFFEDKTFTEMFLFFGWNEKELKNHYKDFRKMEDSEGINLFQFILTVFYLKREKQLEQKSLKKLSKKKKA